jgi:hypothetical protein
VDGSDQTEMLHLDSLVHQLSRNEPHGIQARSRPMQQCPLDARISQIRSRARQISQPLRHWRAWAEVMSRFDLAGSVELSQVELIPSEYVLSVAGSVLRGVE